MNWFTERLEAAAAKFEQLIERGEAAVEKIERLAEGMGQQRDNYPTMLRQMEAVMAALDDLKAAVARETTLVASAKTMIEGFAQHLHDAASAGADEAALHDLANQVTANADALATALSANTPAAPVTDPGSGQAASPGTATS